MTTTTDIASVVADVGARRDDNRAEAAAADRAAREVEEAAAAARAAARQAEAAIGQGTSQALVTIMRALGDEVDAARQEAVDAVITGDDPAGAWCRYQLTAAKILGRWDALGTQYRNLTGSQPPPGPAAHVKPLPGDDVAAVCESFEQFVVAALRPAAKDTRRQSRDETTEAIRAAQARTDPSSPRHGPHPT